MKMHEARAIAGTLSFPSKMPGTGYGIPASACRTGSILAKIHGTVCSTCYALKGTYKRGSVTKAQAKRLAGISDFKWVNAMVRLLLEAHKGPIRVDLGALGVRRQKTGGARFKFNEPGWHRWHDSGDLQSIEHFSKICQVARLTPSIQHWLPTNELKMVTNAVERGIVIPPNLVVRVSSVMIDDTTRRSWPWTSGVYSGDDPPKDAHVCPAPKQDHHCGSCRACWSGSVPHVAYPHH